jgi:O-antigen/teichoic acid export membrane protein
MFQRIRDRVGKSPLIGNFFILFAGSSLIQFIPFLTLPFLTRIYGPENYGILALILAVQGVLMSFTTFQLENTIITASTLPKAFDAFRRLFFKSAWAITFLAMLWILWALWFYQGKAIWLVYIPLILFSAGLNKLFSSISNRTKEYKVLTLTRLTAAVLTPILAIILGLFGLLSHGLLISYVIGLWAPTIIFLVHYHKELFSRKREMVAIGDYIVANKRYLVWAFPAELLNSVSYNIPALFMGALFSKVQVGFFSQANRVLSVPSQFMTSALSEIFRVKAVEDYHSYGTCRPLFIKISLLLALLAFPFFSIMYFWGGDILVFALGDEWQGSGVYVPPLSILFFFRFIASPLSYTVVISGKLHIGLYSDILLLLATVATLYFGIFIMKDLVLAVWLYSLAYGLLYIRTYVISFWCSVRRK